jgi:pilus assembly protein CpaF
MSDDDQPDLSTNRLPQFLSGTYRVSLAGLLERIERQFLAETESRPDILLETADKAARMDLVREVMDYVLSIESITLSRPDRSLILEAVYRDLFNFGPLDPYLSDEAVTEVAIDGPERVSVRRGAGEMTTLDVQFNDVDHLERLTQRVLSSAGTQLSERNPVLEVGAVLAGRPARLTVFGPPVSPVLHIDMRLRSASPATLDGLIVAGMLDEAAAHLLRAILEGGYGLMVAGDVGTGKTTLLEALLPILPEGSLCVERTPELRLPPRAERLIALPPGPDRPPVEFADQIRAALEKQPRWLVLDEVRFDESAPMWEALTAGEDVNRRPRCLWAFRGATEPLRLRTAFGMSVRRAHQGIGQDLIHSVLVDRLPFVATLVRQQ